MFYWFLLLEEVVLIQSGTCEEKGMSKLTSKEDCQEKAKSVGIYDNKVYAGSSSNEVCGCRAFSHKGNLDALHWNDPKGSCSPATKCTKESQCVCLANGKRKVLFLFIKYRWWYNLTLRSMHLTIYVSSSGGSLEQTTPAVGKIDQGLQILLQFKNDWIWQLWFSWNIAAMVIFIDLFSNAMHIG